MDFNKKIILHYIMFRYFKKQTINSFDTILQQKAPILQQNWIYKGDDITQIQ